jgi:16S rRNA (uracil1498-N3)-methyltransferase
VRRRFFVSQFEDNHASIAGEAAHHLGKVLRAQTGQQYELSDGENVYLAQIEKVSRDRVEFTLLEEIASHQPKLSATLLLAVVKFDMFEWALEKATELDVTTIIPIAAERSEKGLLAAATKRSERWQKLLLEASQQSRRTRVPVLETVSKPEPAFAASKSLLKLFLSEKPDAPPLRTLLTGKQSASVTFAIGPEGGWSDSEITSAQVAGFAPASLGKLILRTETAVVAALASVNYARSAD